METDWTLGKPVADVPLTRQRENKVRALLEQAEKLAIAPGMYFPVILPPGVTPRKASQRLYQTLHYARKRGRFMRLRAHVVKDHLYITRLTDEEAVNVNGR